jgi:trk system potassium uptake protein TrkA
MVLQHLAKGDIPQEVIFKMQSGAEAIEGIIHKNKFTEEFFNRPISELPLPEGCVIAAVIRGKDVFMHSKDLLLNPGDKIIVFILGKTDKEKIENLFLTD